MYHIKKDRRAWASARLICEALLHCLQTKPFHEITVSELQRVSSVSRSTFYRHFDSQSDVLELLCDLAFREIFQEFRRGTSIHRAIFHYWYEHSLLLGALVQSGQSDTFIRSFRRSLKAADLENGALRENFPRLLRMLTVCHNDRGAQRLLDLAVPRIGELRIDQRIERSGEHSPEKSCQRIRVLLHENDHRAAPLSTHEQGAAHAAAQIKQLRAGILSLSVRNGDPVRIFLCRMFQILQYICHGMRSVLRFPRLLTSADF